MGKSKVSVFLTDGFETVEALAVIDILRRAGVVTDLISITGSKNVTSAQNIKIEAEYLQEEYNFDDSDLLFLPGGPGTSNYFENAKALDTVRDFYEHKKVAAICAAPSVLGKLGILKGKKAVCFPGYEETLEGAEVVNERVVTDGNVTTSKGMGTSVDLGLELVRILVDDETSNRLAKSTQYVL